MPKCYSSMQVKQQIRFNSTVEFIPRSINNMMFPPGVFSNQLTKKVRPTFLAKLALSSADDVIETRFVSPSQTFSFLIIAIFPDQLCRSIKFNAVSYKSRLKDAECTGYCTILLFSALFIFAILKRRSI